MVNNYWWGSTDIAQVFKTIAHFVSSFVQNASIGVLFKRGTISGDQTRGFICLFHTWLKKREKIVRVTAFWKQTICTVKHALHLYYYIITIFEADAWLLLAIDTVMFCRDHYESDLGFRSSYGTHCSLKQPCKCEMYFTRKRRALIRVKWFCTILLLNCIVVDAFQKDCVKNVFEMRLHISAPLFCNTSQAK